MRQCPAYEKVCSESGKLDHFRTVCKSNGRFNKEKVDTIDSRDESVLCINESAPVNNIETQYEVIKVNGYSIPMQIDTGSSVSVISTTLWERMGKLKLSKSKKNLEAYDGHMLKSVGEFCASIEDEDNFDCINLIMVQFRLIDNTDFWEEIISKEVIHQSRPHLST